MTQRPHVLPCSIFGGRSKSTGKPVGERHRWPNGWGIGRCEYCGRYLDEVMSRPQPQNCSEMPLAAATEGCVDNDAAGVAPSPTPSGTLEQIAAGVEALGEGHDAVRMAVLEVRRG